MKALGVLGVLHPSCTLSLGFIKSSVQVLPIESLTVSSK